jgi:F-type H+-transporting ATPase subunit delta
MLSRSAQSLLRRTATRAMSSESSATSSRTMKLNFSVPHKAIYNNATVYSVILPGVEGEYGVTGGHVSYVAQLKPGVLQILHEEGTNSEPEKYFVAGGMR